MADEESDFWKEGVNPSRMIFEAKVAELEKDVKIKAIENEQLHILNRKLIDQIDSIEQDLVMIKAKTFMNKELSLDYQLLS